jgi:tRNA-2-methylthio-N6-dimethylallyladenosine synthase
MENIIELPILNGAPEPEASAVYGPAAAGKRLYIESYGCQMNFSDSEIVTSILAEEGYTHVDDADGADVVLINTCAIRDNAEQKIRHRLVHLKSLKNNRPGLVIGVLGCMAERLKAKLLDEEKMVDLVVGPDAYRSLPALIGEAESGQKGVNVFLSREETYADIEPVRLGGNGISAFISIMRGCDNMCSFCVVPFTRGRERSRDVHSIVNEANGLFHKGYREVTLLGQNVDSYKWVDGQNHRTTFAELLAMVAEVHPELRVRFSTSHPKDMTDEVLHTMARYPNICNYIHLPAQSGNSAVLERMNRSYDREWYLERIAAIKRILGEDAGISTDIIAGFCGETEEEHQDTLSLMELVQYDYAYMFAYSERPATPAAKKYRDDVAEGEKNKRLNEVITLQREHSLARHKRRVGKTVTVLMEGPAKRGEGMACGRADENNMVVFPDAGVSPGQYVRVLIKDCTSATLIGEVVGVPVFGQTFMPTNTLRSLF